MTVESDRPCAAYAQFLEQLTLDGLPSLDRYVTADVHFRDPFNDVRGIEQMREIFAHMFDDIEELVFEVTDSAEQGDIGWLHWRLSGRIRRLPGRAPWSVEGVSRLRFEPSGRVAEHVDYWDAASGLYEAIPVLGRVLRAIRRRLSVA